MTDCMYWFGLNHRAVEGRRAAAAQTGSLSRTPPKMQHAH